MTNQPQDTADDGSIVRPGGPDAVGPVADEDVDALARALQPDADVDVRLDVTEASEHIGTGTDR